MEKTLKRIAKVGYQALWFVLLEAALILALFGEVPNMSGTVIVVVCHLVYWVSVLVSLALLSVATEGYQKILLFLVPLVIHVLMHVLPLVFFSLDHDHDHNIDPIWRACAGVIAMIALYYETKCLKSTKTKK